MQQHRMGSWIVLTATWDNATWNTITGTFKFDQCQVGSPRLWTQVANGRPGETIIVNKLVLKKAGAVVNAAAEATVVSGSPAPVPITEGKIKCIYSYDLFINSFIHIISILGLQLEMVIAQEMLRLMLTLKLILM